MERTLLSPPVESLVWLPWSTRMETACSSASSCVCFSRIRLNSSSVRASNKRCRRSISAKRVANVLPVSSAFFVPFLNLQRSRRERKRRNRNIIVVKWDEDILQKRKKASGEKNRLGSLSLAIFISRRKSGGEASARTLFSLLISLHHRQRKRQTP